MKPMLLRLKPLALALCVATFPIPASSAETLDALRNTVEMLKKQLEQVQKQLDEQEKTSVTREDLARVEKKAVAAGEWTAPNTLIHMAGYADVGYTNKEGGDNGSFNASTFAPIFHFQYRDLVMLESELDISLQDDGSTEIELEYLTVDLFLNDYITLVAGKFLSPIGQFRQNLHPSWINKLVSAPPGFGHDGAAPVSETGLQFRGGFPVGGMRTNFAVYAGNGPELNSEIDGAEFELEGVRAEAFGRNSNEEMVYGGRFGLLPRAGIEIGVSGATGKASVTELEAAPGTTPPALLPNQGKRDYQVVGADFNFMHRSFGLRGEYVKTRVGSARTGQTASPSATWESWYTQATYRLLPTKWEAIVRYSDFDSAINTSDQEQWAFGVNYLFTNNFMAKFTYELNDNRLRSLADDNRFLSQLAYGF